METGLTKQQEKDFFAGALPWLLPTPLAAEALAKLDRPLAAWMNDPELEMFDSEDFYVEYEDEPGGLSRLEREIAKLPPRPTWRMERVWQPAAGSSDEHNRAYEDGCVTIGGHRLHPRCLDDYSTIAYQLAGLDSEEEDDGDAPPPGDLNAALEWARAGVCVLQQSLPFPFRDVLSYGELDNRPAHRILYAYADLLRHTKPRKAGTWFRAMVFLNPQDNVGARFRAPGGPKQAF
ncbi:hypothetical protein ACFWEV_34905 [Streptomyces bacillaris]|uniref:hypothetical protein n=1 Tax=Streptomyces bacillaris TaxID=68179 RepID=UPI003648282A